MRTLIVTSALTFVPENYDRMVCSIAKHSSVVGLLIIDNRSPMILLKALFLIFSLAGPRMGWTLIKNYFGSSPVRRRMAFESLGKKVWYLSDINSTEAMALVQNEKIDLILNARTRSIFRKALLQLPRLGCINVHHGLLPEQRGLMCDFWAHLENQDFGFSLHQMTTKIDDGPIIQVVKVQSDRTNYLQSLLLASEVEAKECAAALDQIIVHNKISTRSVQAHQVTYRKNPSLIDGYRLQWKGVKL